VTILNVRFTPNELLHPVGDAGIGVVVTQPELVPSLADARRNFPDLRLVLTEDSGGGADNTLDAFRSRGGHVGVADVDEDATALICYSSGTTGFPKGVMLSHRNVREGGLATAVPCGMTHNDRVLITAPLAYTWGISQYLRESLATGATATIVDPGAGIDELIDVLVEDRITMWSTVPVFFERIAASPRFEFLDLSNLRHVVTGGASLHLLQTWQDKGVPLTQAFGLTESGGGHVAMLFNEHIRSRIGWAGRPLLGVDLAIADDEGAFLAAGQEGEIVVRGPMVMQGYLNNPEETTKAMLGDWLRTGDVGLLDEEGFLRVTGRKKDMLRSGGLNVYPAEIERVLAGIRGLEEFAVIGVSDERWGEVPMIVAHDSEPPDLEALKKRCLSDLAGYKRPKYLCAYGKPLPRTFSGKIMKHALQGEFRHAPEHALVLSFKE
jgi:fatty-acyl-CoA synthase